MLQTIFSNARWSKQNRVCLFQDFRRSILLGLFLTLLTQQAMAGGGSIVAAPPNPFGIRALINFTINFRYVPTDNDLQRARQAIEDANDIICDATDGQMVFGLVTITGGSVNESQADVWIYPQNGRSNTSLCNLDADGAHINLFNDDINGRVLAHELGHLALCLGDEYGEQCRNSQGCGLGPAFESGTTDAQNNTLMQSTVQTEFTVPINHDPVRGDAIPCPSPACEALMDMECNSNFYCPGYNTTTMRYESSHHSLIYSGLSEWEVLVNTFAEFGITAPAGLPEAAQPGNCDAYLIIDEQIEGSDLVALIIDRSGSMTIEDAPNPDFGVSGDVSRLEYAKAAGRAFIDLNTTNNIDLAIVSFNQDATVVRSLETLLPSNANDFKDDLNAINAGGFTAIQDGLLQGGFQVISSLDSANNPTMFLLSDGENTAPPNNEVVVSASGFLQENNIKVFTIPVGNGADIPLLTDIAGETGGEILEAQTGDELPPIYVELSAKHQGHSLILERTKFAVAADINIPGDPIADPQLPLSESFFFDVEENAGEITIFLSSSNTNPEEWFPTFELLSPDTTIFRPFDNNIVLIQDVYYWIVRINAPTQGLWRMNISSQTASFNTFGHVLAYTTNPSPELMIDAQPKVARESDVVEITATASFVADLAGDGVNFSGNVIRPDGSIVPISFDYNQPLQTTLATFNQYNGRGVYQVLVRAEVDAASTLIPGEIIFEGPEDPGIVVEPFTRVARTSFYLDVPGFPELENDDCDGDSLSNGFEDQFPEDIDGDGIPNRCDEDSDGDDVPDSEESTEDLNNNGIIEIYDPSFPNPQTCPESSNSIQIEIDTIIRPDCEAKNGLIKIKVSGGQAPYQYVWNFDRSLNGPTASNLAANVYFVTVIDTNGCERTRAFNLQALCFPVDNSATATVKCPGKAPQSCHFPVTVCVDMRNAPAPDTLLGSFTARLKWDPSLYEFAGSPELLSGYTGIVNVDEVHGSILFNGARFDGQGGLIDIFRAHFKAIGPVGSSAPFEVEFEAAAAAYSFRDLLAQLFVGVCRVEISKPGLLGDVNDDGLVNSTDALILMSFDVGLPIPLAAQNRIAEAFGDVNDDGNTNTTDALIILSFDAGIPVPYPIGEPFCPGTVKTKTSAQSVLKSTEPSVHITANRQNEDRLKGTFEVPVYVDMSQIDESLGSYSAQIAWNTEHLSLLSYEGGSSQGFENPLVNETQIEEGLLKMAHAHVEGGKGLIHLFTLTFKALQEPKDEDFSLSFHNMASSKTFVNLLPETSVKESLSSREDSHPLDVYPNPFAQSTEVSFFLDQEMPVKVLIYDLQGELVRVLSQESIPEGRHTLEWDGKDEQGNGLSAGLYIVQLRTPYSQEQCKIVLSK